MSAPPYMKLWIADYLADTTHLTRGEHGAYLLLLMALWRAGGRLPRDPTKLARIAQCTAEEWSEIGPTIMEFFKLSGGSITQKRATKEIAKYQGVVKGSKKAGVASASKRANKNNTNSPTDVEETFNENPTNQNQNQNHKEEQVLALFPAEPEPDAPVAAKAAPSRGTRLKADWRPSNENAAYAASQGFTPAQIERIAEDFRDYWCAKAGAGALKTDWSLTWQSWVRRQDKSSLARQTAPKRVSFV